MKPNIYFAVVAKLGQTKRTGAMLEVAELKMRFSLRVMSIDRIKNKHSRVTVNILVEEWS